MLNGRTALVTNVTHFVGQATAVELATNGAQVFCHDPSFVEADAREAFYAGNPNLIAIAELEAAALITTIVAKAGRIDLLVNNDAFPAIRAPVETAKADDLRAGFEALVTAPFAMAQAAVPPMKARGKGKIVFVTSAAPLRGLSNYAMYCAARGGTNALAISLARELAGFGIRVNAVAPNFIRSPSYFPEELLANADALKKISANIPLGRLGSPAEVAGLIAFLASDRGDFITGQVIPVDGGWA